MKEVPAVIPHGKPGIIIGHASLLHRATERLPEASALGLGHRPMFKLWFGRTEDPMHTQCSAIKEREAACWPPFEKLTPEPSLVPAITSLWEWLRPQHRGNSSECHVDPRGLKEYSALLTSLPVHGDEARRVGASYALGRAAAAGQTTALDVLLQPLMKGQCIVEEQALRRAAVNGLQIAGSIALPPLIALLQKTSTAVELVAAAADAIGECAKTAEEIAQAAQVLHNVMLRLDKLICSSNDGGWPGRQVASSPEGGRWFVAPEVALVSCLLAMAKSFNACCQREDLSNCLRSAASMASNWRKERLHRD